MHLSAPKRRYFHVLSVIKRVRALTAFGQYRRVPVSREQFQDMDLMLFEQVACFDNYRLANADADNLDESYRTYEITPEQFGLGRKVKTRGFLRNIPLSSFSFLCNEEICSISSNLTTALFFRPSAVKVALTSAVPFRFTYQSKVVSDVGVTLYIN